MWSIGHSEPKTQQRSRRQVCRLRGNREQQSQFSEGTARAALQLSRERAQQSAPGEVMAHEQDAAQSQRPLRTRLRRRTAKTTFDRITELRRRLARQQLRQKNAFKGKYSGRPLLYRRLCQTPFYLISVLDTSTATPAIPKFEIRSSKQIRMSKIQSYLSRQVRCSCHLLQNTRSKGRSA